MLIGIDASNLNSGGGFTHLYELLREADPERDGFNQVILWGNRATLAKIEDRPWLIKSTQPGLEFRLLRRILWQIFTLSKLAREEACDILFVPGGAFYGNFHPVVVMSRNLLPFEWCELRRFGCSINVVKMLLLRLVQTHAFRCAEGLIFLTRYANEVVIKAIGATKSRTVIIPHGVSSTFSCQPRMQYPISHYGSEKPYSILYVSAVNVYKHQWNVVEAVTRLRAEGVPLVLNLVGPNYSPALRRLNKCIELNDKSRNFVRYWGSVSHSTLSFIYSDSDLFLFASSCENMPNILLEGMTAGLPIASSSRGPMPEILGDTGLFFDPDDPRDIAHVVRQLIDSVSLREKLSTASFQRALTYSWRHCALKTFSFLLEILLNSKCTPK